METSQVKKLLAKMSKFIDNEAESIERVQTTSALLTFLTFIVVLCWIMGILFIRFVLLFFRSLLFPI